MYPHRIVLCVAFLAQSFPQTRATLVGLGPDAGNNHAAELLHSKPEGCGMLSTCDTVAAFATDLLRSPCVVPEAIFCLQAGL